MAGTLWLPPAAGRKFHRPRESRGHLVQSQLESLPALDGKIITADPLHCQRKTAHVIVEKGGDYLLQIKGNQPRLLKQAQALDSLESTPFLPTPNAPTDGSKSANSTPSPSNR